MSSSRPCILSATNFSPHAIEAATVAGKLARRSSTDLLLVHATEATDARSRTAAGRLLEDEAGRLRSMGVSVQPLLLEGGSSAGAVLDQIRASSPALVVVSSGLKGAIDRWAIGSFSERIAESSPAPTLVVRNPAVFDAWDWTKERLTILLALDLHTTSDVVLR